MLTSLRHKVDSYACTVENFDTLLLRGRIFLLQRERRHEMNQRRRHSRSDSLRASSTTTVSSSQSASGRKNEIESGIDAKGHQRLRQKRKTIAVRCDLVLLSVNSSNFRKRWTTAQHYKPLSVAAVRRFIGVQGRWIETSESARGIVGIAQPSRLSVSVRVLKKPEHRLTTTL